MEVDGPDMADLKVDLDQQGASAIKVEHDQPEISDVKLEEGAEDHLEVDLMEAIEDIQLETAAVNHNTARTPGAAYLLTQIPAQSQPPPINAQGGQPSAQPQFEQLEHRAAPMMQYFSYLHGPPQPPEMMVHRQLLIPPALAPNALAHSIQSPLAEPQHWIPAVPSEEHPPYPQPLVPPNPNPQVHPYQLPPPNAASQRWQSYPSPAGPGYQLLEPDALLNATPAESIGASFYRLRTGMHTLVCSSRFASASFCSQLPRGYICDGYGNIRQHSEATHGNLRCETGCGCIKFPLVE